jgi:negative regulator of sigma-B (phosphoserine phosphatase)
MIEFGVAGRPAPGETVSGDSYIVELSHEATVVAVIDGLGHGPEAAEATSRAAAYLTEHAIEPLVALIEGCHRAIRKTRGVVLAVARFEGDGRSLSWLGVGNVDARVFRSGKGWGQSETLVMRGGVVGYQIPTLRPRSLDLEGGDLMVMATDGILSGYPDALSPTQTVQASADRVLAGYGSKSDDALVLVSRCLGRQE